MIKTKWFELSTQGTLEALATLLSQHEFRRGATSGLELISVNRKQIEGKFIEEIVGTELSLDPYGEEVRNEVHRFSIFPFVIYRAGRGIFLLRVSSPPRSLRSFVQFLADAVGFGLVVSPITVDVRRFVEAVRELRGVHLVRIKKVRVGGIRLSGNSLGRIEVVSANDAYTELLDTLDVRDAVVEKAVIDFYVEGASWSAEISTTGTLTVEEGLLPFLDPLCLEFFRHKEPTTGDD